MWPPVERHIRRPPPERRKHRRFPIGQPVVLRVKSDGFYEISGVTENVSADGVLLSSVPVVPENAEVEVSISLPAETATLFLRANGKVIRVERQPSGEKFYIAVQCDANLEVSA